MRSASEAQYNPEAEELIGRYLEEGWKLLRLHHETKRPVGEKWQRKPGLDRDQALAAVRAGQPIGVQVGEVSGWLSCLDLDSDEAIRLAPHFLPPTLRAGKGGIPSHYVYRSPQLAYAAFDDLGAGRLIDVKASSNGRGHQFVIAPSVHPEKGPYEWIGGFDPASIAQASPSELRAAAGHLAAAALIAVHLPDKGRHDYSLALAGYLLRNGLDEPTTTKILRGAWWCKDAPREGMDAVGRNVSDTAEKLRLSERVKGGRTLEVMVPHLPRKLAKFFGWSSVTDSEGEDPTSEANPLLAGRVDLRRILEHGIEPPEELEPGVLLKGKIHHLFAASESGKTMIALWLIKRRIEAGERVVFFDAENGTRTIAERLERMGVRPAALDRLVYLPFPSLTRGAQGQRNFEELLDKVQPTIIVYDAWASFLSSAGLSENENADVEDWDNAFTKQAKKRSIASVILDHTPHDGIRSRGAARKREVADIQWRVKKTLEFSRDSVGEVVLVIEKDREGWMPGSATFSVGGKDGKLICQPTSGTVEEPSREDGLTPSARKALDTLRREFGTSGATATEWQKAVGRTMSEATFYRGRDTLIERRLISKAERRYYPAPVPGGGKRESGEHRLEELYSPNSHELSFHSHE